MKKNVRKKVLLIIASIASILYIVWRIVFTVPIEYGMLSFVVGLALVVAETIGVIEAFSHYKDMSNSCIPEKPEIPTSWYPSVDILIATHNEPVELLYKTVNACKYMHYPDRGKVNIYICDDNNRGEMRQLAVDLGVKYFGLEENKQAKAGNLNHALQLTDGELIVTFDADMIPRSQFLTETVPYFFLPLLKKDEEGRWTEKEPEEIDEKDKIGFIQTPQSFYNPDLFQFNFYAEKNIPNEQDYFFKNVNVGRNRTNSPIYAGSNTVISRKALEEVGGITTGNITEDFATGIKIQSKGYTCYAIDTPLAHGLAPTDFKSLLKQRQRWGRGCIQTVRSFKFLFGKLPIRTKLSYITCLLYWTTFIRRFIYILSPILFSLFGIVVVDCSLKELLWIWLPAYFIYNQSLKVLSGHIRDQKWSNIVDTIVFPYLMLPLLAETVGIKLKKFAVTPKTISTTKNTNNLYAIPHILLMAASILGLVKCIYEVVQYRSFGNMIIIYWLIINTYFLLMAIVFMFGRVNYRSDERFYARVPISITTSHKNLQGYTLDLSEGGMGIALSYPEFIAPDEEIHIEAEYKAYHCKFKGRVRHIQQLDDQWKYSIRIDELSEYNKSQYMQIIYDREHTLSTKINSHVIKDVYVALKGRVQDGFLSNRKLPRIPINKVVLNAQGQSIKLINYNYEYILMEGIYTEEKITLMLTDECEMICRPQRQDEKMNVTLCKIQDWEVVATNSYVQQILVQNNQEQQSADGAVLGA